MSRPFAHLRPVRQGGPAAAVRASAGALGLVLSVPREVMPGVMVYTEVQVRDAAHLAELAPQYRAAAICTRTGAHVGDIVDGRVEVLSF